MAFFRAFQFTSGVFMDSQAMFQSIPGIETTAGTKKRRRGSFNLGWGAAVALMAATLGLTACGGGNGGSVPGDTPAAVSDLDADKAAFKTTVYDVILTQHCAGSGCHSEAPGENKDRPAFAYEDINVAYQEITTNHKVDLDGPTQSRIFRKPKYEKHYCWTADCDADAQQILDQIKAWAVVVPSSPSVNKVNEQTIKSSAQKLSDGKRRVTNGIVAQYLFDEGTGSVTRDSSDVPPAMDLTLTGAEWLTTSHGLKFAAASAYGLATATTSKKLSDMIASATTGSGEYTVEAWVMPDNVTQTKTEVVAYATNGTTRNFNLAQATTNYSYANRSSVVTATTGEPALATTKGEASAALQHIVATFDKTLSRTIYVNGVVSAQDNRASTLTNWNTAYIFSIGNDNGKGTATQWKGNIYMVAVYKRALQASEVVQNYQAGSTGNTLLHFDISAASGVAGSAIELSVDDSDDVSYVFGHPTYVGPAAALQISGLRIAMNDKVVGVGQAYANLNVTLSPQDTSSVLLSRVGTAMAKDYPAGHKDDSTLPTEDTLMLTFDMLGTQSNIVPEPVAGELTVKMDRRSVVPVSGVRTFDQINDMMSQLTGVPQTTTAIIDLYEGPLAGNVRSNGLKQSMPSTANLMAFVPAQQVGITKLAAQYCDSMVANTTLRAAFFDTTPATVFGLAVTAFNTQPNKDLIINTLITKMVGTNLGSQPSQTEAYTEVSALINTLITNSVAGSVGGTTSTRTQNIIKGACAAVLSSAALTIH